VSDLWVVNASPVIILAKAGYLTCWSGDSGPVKRRFWRLRSSISPARQFWTTRSHATAPEPSVCP
jgi:hypothetical protein